MLCEETVIRADTAVSAYLLHVCGGGIASPFLSITHWTTST